MVSSPDGSGTRLPRPATCSAVSRRGSGAAAGVSTCGNALSAIFIAWNPSSWFAFIARCHRAPPNVHDRPEKLHEIKR
jgi:hypothetical protein